MKQLKLLYIFLLFTTGSLIAQWEIQLDVENFTHLGNIFFLDENTGWAIGDNSNSGPYFYTTDGGQNWYLDENWIDNNGTDIVFVNHDTGFISANNGIIRKTIDGGQNWVDIQTPATQRITSLFFVDENNGWATLHNSGNLLYTVDGGNIFELKQVYINTPSIVSALFFIDNNTGWVSGGYDDGSNIYYEILFTNDQGSNWYTQYSVIYLFHIFYDIFFADSLNGWAVGQKSSLNTYLILKTENGGETWQEDTIPDLIYPGGFVAEVSVLYSIQFINDTLGWITGADETNSGCILLTKDGGETWKQQEVEYYYENPIYDICMVDENNGWAVGGSYIYHTTNGDTIVGLTNHRHTEEFIKINPNPFKDFIHLQIPGNYHVVEVLITDIKGNICFRKSENINKYIDLNFLQKGIYFISIQYNSSNQIYSLTKKIIKF